MSPEPPAVFVQLSDGLRRPRPRPRARGWPVLVLDSHSPRDCSPTPNESSTRSALVIAAARERVSLLPERARFRCNSCYRADVARPKQSGSRRPRSGRRRRDRERGARRVEGAHGCRDPLDRGGRRRRDPRAVPGAGAARDAVASRTSPISRRRLGIHPSTATRLCDRLVKKGLLDRVTSSESRRETNLTATTQGRALVRAVSAPAPPRGDPDRRAAVAGRAQAVANRVRRVRGGRRRGRLPRRRVEARLDLVGIRRGTVRSSA